jgi:alpha-ketoglutarate-dependent taurine dioxygenase
MRFISLGPRFAAELRGVDLIDVATSDAAYCAVREAFEEHSVILFRNQETSNDVQVAFSRAFGHSSAPRSAPEAPTRFMSIAPMSRRTPR